MNEKKTAPAPFWLDFSVRDSELDQYGVVNNAVYQVYLEHARHEFLHHIGLDAAAVAQAGRSLALSGITLRYRTPLRSRERFAISVALSRLSGVRAEFYQLVIRKGEAQPCCEAWAEAVFLDGRGRPIRIPEDFRSGVQPYLIPPR